MEKTNPFGGLTDEQKEELTELFRDANKQLSDKIEEICGTSVDIVSAVHFDHESGTKCKGSFVISTEDNIFQTYTILMQGVVGVRHILEDLQMEHSGSTHH